MKTERSFNPMTDRYEFDFVHCSSSNGFAQIDTGQDASYFGIWTNPETMVIFTYAEGDITKNTCDSKEEFIKEINDIVSFYEFVGIDCGFNQNHISDKFHELKLQHLLH